MKLALHRSITFWSGLLVMVFFVWVWWDSTTHDTRWSYERLSARHAWDIKVSDGAFRVTHRVPNPASYGLSTGQRIITEPMGNFDRSESLTPQWFAWPEWTHKKNPTLEVHLANIPFWLLLPTAGIPWIALLRWRARRRGRADHSLESSG